MTEEQKAKIDAMSHAEMASLWRFAPSGHPLLSGEAGEYFSKAFKEKGGMTPGISKAIGLERG